MRVVFTQSRISYKLWMVILLSYWIKLEIYAIWPLICVNYLMLDWFPLGVKSVEVDLDSQVVRILGSTPLKSMTEALEQTGRKTRLIGQGIPEG